MQSHRRPATTIDNRAWEHSNPELPFHACLVYVKGDWLEHSRTLGLARWDQFHSPCQFCTLVKSEVHSLADQFSADEGCPWPLRSHEDYDRDCSLCEKIVHVTTEEQLQQLVASIAPLKRKDAVLCWGICRDRCLIAGVELKYGDRAEPSESLVDVQQLRWATLPLSVTFWRSRFGEHTKLVLDSVHHRCPLFDNRLGTSPARTLAVDELHTFHLGLLHRTTSAALWRTVLGNPWDFQGSNKSIIDKGVRKLWIDLKAWQQDPKNGIPRGQGLNNLTPKMLGKLVGRSPQDAILCFIPVVHL